MCARILIVEDEAIVGKDIERMLIRQDHGVCDIVATGEEAIAASSRDHPDLILMDIKLRGDMDGVDAATQIRLLFQLPVVYITAHSDRNTLERAKATKPYGYLLKPIDARDLSIVVEMALNMFESERKLQESQIQYQTILETALDGFWVVNPDAQLLDVNEVYCTRMGYTRNELLQMQIADLEAVESSKVILWHLNKIANCGSDRFESTHRSKDGSLVDFEISVRCIHEQKRFYVYLRDITERRKREKEILQLNKELIIKAQESLNLYHAEREQREFTEMLSEASQMLVSTLDINLVLDRILEQISRIVKNDVCNIVLLQGEETKVVRSRGYEAFDAGSFIETFVFPLSELSVRKQIMKDKEAIVVPDVSKDRRWHNSSGETWLRSYIAVPILIQTEVVGLINVGISMPGYYTHSHARHLQAFAYQAAIAFQNAHLFEDAQQTANQLEVLSGRLLEIQETERRVIARELHDEVGQGLTAVQLNLQALLQGTDMQACYADIKNCVGIVEAILKQVRSISLNLHPSLLDDLGLVPALRWLVDREAQWAGFTAQVVADHLESRLPASIELVCYRVVQEALTNVARHAQAKKVTVELWKRGLDLHLFVRDDGMGFNVLETMENAARGNSLGLLGMRERVALVKGEMEINSTPDHGTEIHARFPLHQEDCQNRIGV